MAISSTAAAGAEAFPPVSDRAPISTPHFPDALHATVWRNWHLVPPHRLAKVLNATVEQVTGLATSMGLPRDPQVPPEMIDRGYLTIIRCNWHLLPYEQLEQLLGVTSSQLAFTLREDDGLYIKLGSMKPKCEPVRYVEPSSEARRRAALIKQRVQQHFNQSAGRPWEPRFAFVSALSQADGTVKQPQAPSKSAGSEGPRFVYSYFALFGDPLIHPDLDPYPAGLLQRLRQQGVNGVWLHVVLRQLAPGGPTFPEWGDGHPQRLANLRALVDRARQFGIDVYLYMNEPRAMPSPFFRDRPEMAGVTEDDYTALCTSNPRVRTWLSDSLAHVFREVPGLGGIFTITASENFTSCASHGHREDCPRCKHRSNTEIIAEVNSAMAEGVHRSAPDAKVIVWDWGWQPWVRSGDPKPAKPIDPEAPGDAPDIVNRLPRSVWMMAVSEWSLPIERGGVKSRVGEYSISAVGPGPRATRLWQLAKQQGLKTVAKVQLNNTWELSSVPYLPVMDLVAEHCSRLAQAEIDGMMLSWSLGGYPSPNLELAQRFSQRPAPDPQAALQATAEQNFGPQAALHVRQAWTKFSRALAEFPFHIQVVYRGPQQLGPANLLYAVPTGYAAGVVVAPYDDLTQWSGPYPSDVLAAQFQKVAEGWADGLADLRAAQPLVPENLQRAAVADLGVAEAAQIHFASAANQARFILARDKLRSAKDNDQRQRLREELISLLDKEIELARRLYDLAVVDSRLGYEASNHYYYVPHDLMEKVINCEHLREQYAAGS